MASNARSGSAGRPPETLQKAAAAARLVKEVAALSGRDGVTITVKPGPGGQSLVLLFARGGTEACALADWQGEVRVGSCLSDAVAAAPLPSLKFNPSTLTMESDHPGPAKTVFLVALNVMMRQRAPERA